MRWARESRIADNILYGLVKDAGEAHLEKAVISASSKQPGNRILKKILMLFDSAGMNHFMKQGGPDVIAHTLELGINANTGPDIDSIC